MFSETKSRETLRFEGNKIHFSPRDQSLSDLSYSKTNGSKWWKTLIVNSTGCHQDGGRTHTRVIRKFLCCFMVSDLLLTINHLQVDGEGYRKCEEAGGGI